jgi:catechol 2,3-dioxygenase-like lactoylglutathione lyase family enzyme
LADGSILDGLTIVQVAFVTRDLEACTARQSALLGNGPWRVYELGARNIRDYTLHGEPATGSTLLALNDSRPQVEILQPLGGATCHREWLDDHGEGVHHVAAVVPSVDDTCAAAAAEGIEVVSAGWGFGPDGSGSFAYLDTRSVLGVLLEVFEPPTSLGEPLRQL